MSRLLASDRSPRPSDVSASDVDVELRSVSISFGAGATHTVAVQDATGVVGAGRFVSLIGPSGCGKSSLLDVVAGLSKPSSGDVCIGGERVNSPRRDLAMVFQDDSTLHWRSVIDNVALGLEVAGVSRRERHERAGQMLSLVGLAGFEKHRPTQLSGGMRQRVAIARALVMNPSLLLMDEPFGALDQQTRTIIGKELLRIWDETRNSVLFVTHDIREAVTLSDEVWVMSRRPSTILQRVQIDLPRPRGEDVLRSAEFTDIVNGLWDLIEQEVAEAMREQEGRLG